MENTQAQLAQAAYQLPLPRLHQVNHLKILIVWLVLQLTGYCWKATSITAIHVPEP